MLGLPPYLSVILISLVILFIINIFYKILIKQHEAKKIKENINELNKKMREAQKKSDKDAVNKLFREIMSENNKIMKMSLKPMLISFLIVILILPFLSSTYSDRTAIISDGKGNVTLEGNLYQVQKNESTLTVGNTTCQLPCREKIEGSYWQILPEGNNVKFARIVVILPYSLPFIQDKLGWLGWYILASIPLMIIIRKLLKIYV